MSVRSSGRTLAVRLNSSTFRAMIVILLQAGTVMRGLLILVYLILTAVTCVSAMVKSSLFVGAAALAGSLLCFFAAATFCASFLAKREHQYKATDLLGIGAIATVLTVAGFALMIWSGFWISLYGVVIQGPYWVLIGILVAIVTAKKSFAL